MLFYFKIGKKMKKLVLLLAVVFSVSLFSCGGAKTEAAAEAVVEEAEAVEAVVEDTTVVDTAAVDTIVVEAPAV